MANETPKGRHRKETGGRDAAGGKTRRKSPEREGGGVVVLEPDTYTKDETNWKTQAMRVTKATKGVDAKEFYATAVRADVDEVKLVVKSGRFYDNGHAVYAEVQYDLCLWEQGIRGGSVVTVNIGPMLQQEINNRDDRDHREAVGGDYEDGEFVRDEEESESEQEGEVSPAGGRPL